MWGVIAPIINSIMMRNYNVKRNIKLQIRFHTDNIALYRIRCRSSNFNFQIALIYPKFRIIN